MTCDTSSDADLIERHLQGSPTALSQLWLRYDRLVFGIAHSVMRSAAAAEDVRQETFLKVYQNLDTLRDSEKFVSWLRNIAYNTCYAFIRRRKATTPLEAVADDELPSQPSGAADVELRELRTLLRQMIDRLPEDYRTVIELKHFNGASVAEIASFLELPETTIRWRLRKGRETLRKRAEINGYLDD